MPFLPPNQQRQSTEGSTGKHHRNAITYVRNNTPVHWSDCLSGQPLSAPVLVAIHPSDTASVCQQQAHRRQNSHIWNNLKQVATVMVATGHITAA